MKEMMKHTLLYIAVSGMTLLTSCQLGKHYTRPDLHLPQQLDTLRQQDTLSIADMHGGKSIRTQPCKADRKDVG